MASRRMKMKVTVNTGRGGAMGRSGASDRARPPTPVSTSNDGDSNSALLENLHVPAPKSPVKHFSSINFPLSPVKSSTQTAASPAHRTVSESETEEEMNLIFNEEEISEFRLVPVVPVTSGDNHSLVPTESRSTSSSPTKHVTCTDVAIPETRRGPGTGPPLKPCSNTSILSNIQRELGHVHAGHVKSNETLRQRLQKGSGATNTKYSILRKEFLRTTRNKTPENKDLTILHFTFWNPPGEDLQQKKSDVDDLFEGIDTSVMKSAEILLDPASPATSSVTDEPKKSVGPRVKVGPDGELIIDEQSLVVETSESVRAKKQLSEMETVMAAGSGYYRHKRIPRRGYDWTVKETVRFFKALTMCGTDFSMMAHLFPNRSRAELKAKFKREDRKNTQLVSQALAFQRFDPLESMTESEESDNEKPSKRKRSLSNGSHSSLSAIRLQRKESLAICHARTPNDDTVLSPVEVERPLLAIEYPSEHISQPDKTSEKSPAIRRRKIKSSTAKSGEVSKMGRPMGIGDSSKIKSAFREERRRMKLESKQRKHEKLDDVIPDNPDNATPVANLRRKSSNKTKKSKRVKEDPSPNATAIEGDNCVPVTVEPDEVSDPRPAILRFDADDPLGLKVVGSTENIDAIETTENVSASVDPVDNNVELQNEKESCINPLTSTTPGREPPLTVPKERRSTKVKVKPRIPRVPGGGGPVPGGERTVQGGDEIEIEISCL